MTPPEAIADAIAEAVPGTPPADLPEPRLSENARTVLARRYLQKNDAGEPIEEPRDMFWRVARVIASVDARYGAPPERVERTARRFYEMMAFGQFEPNSPTLMNAGRPLGQLSACFVLPVPDSLDGIYETLKDMALIHQSGGGCVAADAHVHTTFCGVETIETLYDRVRELGVPEEVWTDHRIMDVSHLGIRTMAVDPDSGRFLPKAVSHLWRWEVPADARVTVRCVDGSTATTSGWHPFMVFTEDGVVERRADALRPGDLLLAPNRSVREGWPIARPAEAEGFAVDEDLAWLAGFALGAGRFDLFRLEATGYEVSCLTLAARRPEVVECAARILERYGIGVTPGRDASGEWRLVTANQGFVPAFARLLGASEPDGEATVAGGLGGLPTLPEWAAKSPVPVIAAFLGGLVDGAGRVSPGRSEVRVRTASGDLARRLVSLLSALGFAADLSAREAPDGSTYWAVLLASPRRSVELAEVLAPHVRDPLRATRLARMREAGLKGDGERIPVPFGAIEPLLWGAGIDTSSLSGGAPVTVAGEVFRLDAPRRGEGIEEEELRRLARALGRVLAASFRDPVERLERLAEGWTVVESVERAASPAAFYDFTVEGLNNYLAGGGPGKMLVIHNTGFAFSRLRPAGDVVKSTMGVASGPVSFMEVYDASTEAVKQGGTRRGANMGILRVDHPDILEFIDCKAEKDRITNFNISVAVTDAFMRAVEKGESYDLVNPRTKEVTGRLDAREVFAKIVHGAWRNGEPGVFFIDEANRYNPVPALLEYEATNPCGEQPIGPYDVCNLGSINVGHCVRDGKIDWEGLRGAVHDSTHFLDNVIDANRYPLEKIHDLSHAIRRIGLGVMGWADMLVRLGEPYGSKRSIELGREVMRFVDEEAKVASERLAEERGEFPAWEQSIWGPDETCARNEKGERIRPMRRLRNCNVTTVAPTGTISIIAGCSSGIEPLFAVAFMRNQAGVLMPDVNSDFVEAAEKGGWYSEELMRRIADEGHIHFGEVPEKVQRIFVTAHDVTPEQHIRMQAAFQQYTDSAISKTCNFAESATENDVREIFELAYKLKCKGVTVYRDASRDAQVLSTGKTARRVQAAANGGSVEVVADGELAEELAAALDRISRLEKELEEKTGKISELEGGMMRAPIVRERPAVLRGVTRKIESPLGTMYVTVNEDEKGRPFEVFIALGKAGGPAMADAEAIGRLISLALRSGISLREIFKQLRGISSDRAVGLGPNKVLSSPDAIAQAIERYLEEKEGVQTTLPIGDSATEGKKANGGVQSSEKPIVKRIQEQEAAAFIGTCPDCGSSLSYAEGCAKCYACGYSECG